MKTQGIKNVLIALLTLTNIASLYFIHKNIYFSQPSPAALITPGVPAVVNMTTVTYKTKEFDLAGKIDGLSSSQINQHLELYAGYAKKRNEITQALMTVDRTNVANRTYSPYRSLKIAETYAVNGSLLHELYFENLSPENIPVGKLMMQLIEKSFGSFDSYKKDLFDSASCARGWAVTMYGMDDGLLHNYVLEEHNTHVPVLSIPLVVCDVYEHAYMIDYGIKRDPYLVVFFNHINWNVVEKRIAKWVQPLQEKE